MNNDTPRTNANAVWPASNDDSDRESPDGSHVPVDFARELERENARLREALNRVASQAVCAGMDGPDGDSVMLINCFDIAEEALSGLPNDEAHRARSL
jgi:hypothetical protein